MNTPIHDELAAEYERQAAPRFARNEIAIIALIFALLALFCVFAAVQS